MPLSKKEKENLRAHHVQVEKDENKFIVKMSLTTGELLALKNALEHEPTIVGEYVRDYLNNALQVAKVDF